MEAKDIGVSLDTIEQASNRPNPSTANGNRLKRYRGSLPNLLLTDYTEFRWYVDGQRRSIARLAELDGSGRLVLRNGDIADTGGCLPTSCGTTPPRLPVPKTWHGAARLTHLVRDIVAEGFRWGKLSQDVTDLFQASKNVLVPDLSESDFADMFAQTLAYGLFAARVNHDSAGFSRQDAARQIPPTNPVIRPIFSLVSDPALDDEPFVGFVDDLAQLLGNADMEGCFPVLAQGPPARTPLCTSTRPFWRLMTRP